MNPIIRIIGKRGNTTIPYPLRVQLGIRPHDILSYACENDCIVIKRETLCSGCRDTASFAERADAEELKELLSSLPEEAKREALIFLSTHMANVMKGIHHVE